MTTVFKKLYLLVSEIEEMHNKVGTRKRASLLAALWTLKAIGEISMTRQEWTRNPCELLKQLDQELMMWERARWGARIQEILREI
jgi:hypothetical protein